MIVNMQTVDIYLIVNHCVSDENIQKEIKTQGLVMPLREVLAAQRRG